MMSLKILTFHMTTYVQKDEESYFTRIKANPIAREVKINDLMHNLDEYRVVTPTRHLIEKRVKYRRELAFLQGYSDTL